MRRKRRRANRKRFQVIFRGVDTFSEANSVGEQMSKLAKLVAQDQVRRPSALGSVRCPEASLEALKCPLGLGRRIDRATPETLQSLKQSLHRSLKSWSDESEAWYEEKEIRPSMSNSSVSTMSSFETNRSRACSNGSIGSGEESKSGWEFEMIEEASAPTWDAHWKRDYYGAWEASAYYLGHDHMEQSPFTTPTPSPKPANKDFMHGRWL